MKDSRTTLDDVRAKLRGDEKILVVHLDHNGNLRCAQSNCTQADIDQFANSLLVNSMAGKVGVR